MLVGRRVRPCSSVHHSGEYPDCALDFVLTKAAQALMFPERRVLRLRRRCAEALYDFRDRMILSTRGKKKEGDIEVSEVSWQRQDRTHGASGIAGRCLVAEVLLVSLSRVRRGLRIASGIPCSLAQSARRVSSSMVGEEIRSAGVLALARLQARDACMAI